MIGFSLLLCFGIILYVVCVLIQMVLRSVSRKMFSKKYNIGKLPRNVRVKKIKKKEYNYFVLRYPYWQAGKKDGTADLRVHHNTVCWKTSSLYIDTSLLESKKPYDILYVVKKLRLQKTVIAMCKEEKSKYYRLLDEKKLHSQKTSIQELINYYEQKPTDFEKICAELYQKMGYVSKITAPTNDGGYDIIITKGNTNAIIECKCYSLNNKVGRPAIQKLVGANKIVQATRMIFITTSEFSNPAITYAKQTNVELIDGNDLIELLRKYMFIERKKIHVNRQEWQLEIEDMQPYVPSDIYKEYFLTLTNHNNLE